MRIDILTLFPDAVGAMMHESILGRAEAKGLITIKAWQIRDYTSHKQNQVDDYPYGGGHGAILQADPLYRCWEAVCDEAGGAVHTVGEGVSFPGGFKEVAASYSVENPLYGEAADGFTVLLNVKVTGTINHYESMFGFSDSAAPAQMSKTFTVSGSGEGVHLNRVGEWGFGIGNSARRI